VVFKIATRWKKKKERTERLRENGRGKNRWWGHREESRGKKNKLTDHYRKKASRGGKREGNSGKKGIGKKGRREEWCKKTKTNNKEGLLWFTRGEEPRGGSWKKGPVSGGQPGTHRKKGWTVLTHTKKGGNQLYRWGVFWGAEKVGRGKRKGKRGGRKARLEKSQKSYASPRGGTEICPKKDVAKRPRTAKKDQSLGKGGIQGEKTWQSGCGRNVQGIKEKKKAIKLQGKTNKEPRNNRGKKVRTRHGLPVGRMLKLGIQPSPQKGKWSIGRMLPSGGRISLLEERGEA